MSAELELTSWRRMTSELYAAVRAEDDPQRGHALWRRGRDDLFRSHPQSPLPPGDPLRKTGLPYWPYDPGLRFEVPLLPAGRAMSLSIPTSDGVTPMACIGCVQLPPPLEAVIDVWWLRQYAGGLFLAQSHQKVQIGASIKAAPSSVTEYPFLPLHSSANARCSAATRRAAS